MTNPAIGILSNPKVYSYFELTDGNTVPCYPEFGYFKNIYSDKTYTPEPDTPDLTSDQGVELLSVKLNDYRTLLNPGNLYSYFNSYENDDKISVMTRFDLASFK